LNFDLVGIAQLQPFAVVQGLFKFQGRGRRVGLGPLAERRQLIGIDVGAVLVGTEEREHPRLPTLGQDDGRVLVGVQPLLEDAGVPVIGVTVHRRGIEPPGPPSTQGVGQGSGHLGVS